MDDERGAPGEQMTAIEAAAAIKVSDDPEHPKDPDSNHLGVDQTGIIRLLVPAAQVHEVSPPIGMNSWSRSCLVPAVDSALLLSRAR